MRFLQVYLLMKIKWEPNAQIFLCLVWSWFVSKALEKHQNYMWMRVERGIGALVLKFSILNDLLYNRRVRTRYVRKVGWIQTRLSISKSIQTEHHSRKGSPNRRAVYQIPYLDTINRWFLIANNEGVFFCIGPNAKWPRCWFRRPWNVLVIWGFLIVLILVIGMQFPCTRVTYHFPHKTLFRDFHDCLWIPSAV